MKEQTKVRLDIITARHARRLSEAGDEAQVAAARALAFARDYERALTEVVSPAMEQVGAELARAGHGYRIELGAPGGRRTVELHVLITGARRESTSVIRMFLAAAPERRPEVIAEVEVMSHPMELTRYREIGLMTPDVIEQLLVDAVEHLFACNSG